MAAHRRHDKGASPPPAAAARARAADAAAVAAARAAAQGIDEIMSADVSCVGEGASLAQLCELLVERGQHCVPVVAPEGRPVGMVTQTDVLRSIGEAAESADQGAPLQRTAGEIMTALVFALPVTASVEQAAALMAYEGVEQIVVTGLGGEVAGVVRALDVARRCARSAGYLVDREE
jgi:CBS domain-containing protein